MHQKYHQTGAYISAGQCAGLFCMVDIGAANPYNACNSVNPSWCLIVVDCALCSCAMPQHLYQMLVQDIWIDTSVQLLIPDAAVFMHAS